MPAAENIGITAKKSDLSEWYTQVVAKAELAEYTAVSGCIVFRPYAYAIWEKIQGILDAKFKETGHKNAYFPLFIPESLLKKEAAHIKGFSPEVAWVTHSGETALSEKLAIRPTSETIIYDSYKKWIRSWRDLPLLLNQWCSVVRWEFKYPKPFLRTREFLWQEGHTAHATNEEAANEALQMLDIYAEAVQDHLALPVIKGMKSEQEKFAGADYTLTIESRMPDGKALQMGTSHNLGQNFSKAFGITFLGQDGKHHQVWQTSWGLSTRVIGALIMAHGDDKGLVLPPKIAPIQVVIVPIFKAINKDTIFKAAKELSQSLSKKFSVHLDDREGYSPGWKFNEWELKGVPIRIEIGPKDIEKGQVVLMRRDTREKQFLANNDLEKNVGKILDAMHISLMQKQEDELRSNSIEIASEKDILSKIKERKFVLAGFCGSAACEKAINESSGGATSRCTPFDASDSACVHCQNAGKKTYFAKAY